MNLRDFYEVIFSFIIILIASSKKLVMFGCPIKGTDIYEYFVVFLHGDNIPKAYS